MKKYTLIKNQTIIKVKRTYKIRIKSRMKPLEARVNTRMECASVKINERWVVNATVQTANKACSRGFGVRQIL